MSIERPLRELEQTEEKKRRFLAAWKEGVRRLGGEFFGPGEAAAAEDTTQLAPQRAVVEERFAALSRGQQQLLGAMVSFRDPEWGAELAARTEDTASLCGLTFNLDRDEAEIVAELLRNYTGWEEKRGPA